MENLPNDITRSILSYLELPSLGLFSRTSKKCYKSATDPSLPQWKVTEELIVRIAPRLTELQNLDLASCKYAVTEASFNAIAEHCTSLRRLGLYECKDVSQSGIIKIIQSCHQMRRLILHRCSSLTDEVLLAIGQNLPLLETLNVSYCDNLTSPPLVLAISKCTKLRKIILSHCKKVDQSVIGAIATHLSDTIVKLSIGNCNIKSSEHLTPLEQCKKLQMLDLSDLGGMHDTGLEKVFVSLQFLNILDLSSARSLTNKIILLIAENCTQLKILNISQLIRVTDKAMIPLLQNCTKLKLRSSLNVELTWYRKLLLNGCKKLTDATFSLIGAYSHRFIEVGLSGLNITDAGLIPLVQQCPKLLQLNISQCINITSSSLYKITNTLQQLRTLNIAQCFGISKNSMIAFHNQHPNVVLKGYKE